MSNESGLPPHWVSADDQLRAGLRETQRKGRESQARMWRRAGYSETAVQQKMADHNKRVSAMHEAVQSGVQDRAPVTPDAAASSEPRPESKPEPPPAAPAAPAPPRREPTAQPSWWDMAEPAPGRASRWLTGYYRYGVGIVAGLVVALLAWIVLQGVGQAVLGMAMWSWPSMLLAAIVPTVGLLWWFGEVHREVRHFIDFGGRVPVRFRRR